MFGTNFRIERKSQKYGSIPKCLTRISGYNWKCCILYTSQKYVSTPQNATAVFLYFCILNPPPPRPLSVWFLFRTSGNTVKQARLPPPKCMAWISGWGIFPNYLMPENNHRNDWIPNLFGGPNEAGKYEMTISLFHPESQKLTESLLAPLSAVLL